MIRPDTSPASLPILVVDDDPNLANSLAELLRREGYAVETAPHGRAAMQFLTHRAARMVISDIFMPEGDGIELLNFLRQRAPAPPLLAMSGAGANRIVDMLKVAGALGAARVLSKPFAPAHFIKLVREITGPPGGTAAAPAGGAPRPAVP